MIREVTNKYIKIISGTKTPYIVFFISETYKVFYICTTLVQLSKVGVSYGGIFHSIVKNKLIAFLRNKVVLLKHSSHEVHFHIDVFAKYSAIIRHDLVKLFSIFSLGLSRNKGDLF